MHASKIMTLYNAYKEYYSTTKILFWKIDNYNIYCIKIVFIDIQSNYTL